MEDREFGDLLMRHHALLLKVAQHLLGSYEDALDAVQETYLRAWHYRARVDEEREIGGWLVIICRHHCLDQLRSRQRRAQQAAEMLPNWLTDPKADTETDVTSNMILIDALNSISLPMRRIFMLRYVEGMDCGEIGVVMGIEKRAAISRCFRAREALRHVLNGGLST